MLFLFTPFIITKMFYLEKLDNSSVALTSIAIRTRERLVKCNFVIYILMFHNSYTRKTLNIWFFSFINHLYFCNNYRKPKKPRIFYDNQFHKCNRDYTSVTYCSKRLEFYSLRYYSVMIWNLWKLAILLAHYMFSSVILL